MKSSINTIVDVEASKANLERLGFEKGYVNGECMVKNIEGTYAFRVTAHLYDWDPGEPLHRAHFDVVLPHQCDSWQILHDEEDVAAARELMQAFIKETRDAGQWLMRATGAVVYKERS